MLAKRCWSGFLPRNRAQSGRRLRARCPAIERLELRELLSATDLLMSGSPLGPVPPSEALAAEVAAPWFRSEAVVRTNLPGGLEDWTNGLTMYTDLPVHWVSDYPNGLTSPSQDRPEEIVRAYLAEHMAEFGAAREDLDSLRLEAPPSTDPYLTVVRLRQQLNGLPVSNAYIQGNIAPDGRLLGIAGFAIPLAVYPGESSRPRLTAAEAYDAAASQIGIPLEPGPFGDPPGQAIPPQLHYLATPTGPVLAWCLQMSRELHAFQLDVDARTGDLIGSADLLKTESSPRPVTVPERAVLSTLPAERDDSTIVVNPGEAPSEPQAGEPEAIAREYLAAHPAQFQATAENLAAAYVDVYRSAASGSAVKFEQRLGGIPVSGSSITVNIDAEGRVTRVYGRFVGISQETSGGDLLPIAPTNLPGPLPTLTAIEALDCAAALIKPNDPRPASIVTDVGPQINQPTRLRNEALSRMPIYGELVYDTTGGTRLAWRFWVHTKVGNQGENQYIVSVDAQDGRLLSAQLSPAALAIRRGVAVADTAGLSEAGLGSNAMLRLALYHPSTAMFDVHPRASQWLGGGSILATIADSGPVWYGPSRADIVPLSGDWNADGQETIGVYDPALSRFYLKDSITAGNADVTVDYGVPGLGWIAIAGDWDGDGTATVGVYDPANSAFYLKNTNTAGAADKVFQFGWEGGNLTPLVGDWNGDGVDGVGVYDGQRGLVFLTDRNDFGAADWAYYFGAAGAGWRPLACDWDGNGSATLGLVDPATGTVFLSNAHRSGPADATIQLPADASDGLLIAGQWRDWTPPEQSAFVIAFPNEPAIKAPGLISSLTNSGVRVMPIDWNATVPIQAVFTIPPGVVVPPKLGGITLLPPWGELHMPFGAPQPEGQKGLQEGNDGKLNLLDTALAEYLEDL